MIPKKQMLLEMFKSYFPGITVGQYWPKGNDALRIRPSAKCPQMVSVDEDLIFTWAGKDNWSLMSVSVYDELITQNEAKKKA